MCIGQITACNRSIAASSAWSIGHGHLLSSVFTHDVAYFIKMIVFRSTECYPSFFYFLLSSHNYLAAMLPKYAMAQRRINDCSFQTLIFTVFIISIFINCSVYFACTSVVFSKLRVSTFLIKQYYYVCISDKINFYQMPKVVLSSGGPTEAIRRQIFHGCKPRTVEQSPSSSKRLKQTDI